MNDSPKTGGIIGILGGGQLGRMLSISAARLGFRSHIFDPSPSPPAADVAHSVTCATYHDEAALCQFAKAVDVITYEFENIPTSALDTLEKFCPIQPGREALRVSQDRVLEKEFLNNLGLKTAPYAPIETIYDLKNAIKTIGVPAILKTRRFGYDGKGQTLVKMHGDAEKAFKAMQGQASILEGFVEFTHEVSVIGARNVNGDVACFDPGENVHRNGILHTTTVPARLNASERTDAILLTAKIMNKLEYVGVMGVELFVTSDGLIVNEIAPRVHNSGHWTQDACVVDQFEQHIRAVLGWPLGDATRHTNIVMENLVGFDVKRAIELAGTKNVAVHLYGKAKINTGRKMGHFNRILT